MEARQPQIGTGFAEPEWEVARLFPPRGEWTEDDYLSLPNNRGVELADGFLEFLPAPTESHHLVVGYLYRAFHAFVATHELGLVLFVGIPVRLWANTMRQPDVVFLHRDHAQRRRSKYWEGADLVVEVVSPKGRKRDVDVKRAEYAQAGIPEYWIVDPEAREVQVLTLEKAEYRVHGVFGAGTEATSIVLAGFSVSVEALFASTEESF